MAVQIDGGIGWSITDDSVATDPDYASVVLHVPFQSDLLDTKGNSLTSETTTPSLDGSESPYAGGDSAVFNGTTDKLRAADDASFEMGSGDFTIDLWARFTDATSSCLITKAEPNNNANGPYGICSEAADKPQWVMADTTLSGAFGFFHNYVDSGVLSASTWYHLSMVRSGTNAYSFLDGVLLDTAAIGSAALRDTANDLVIGSIFHISGYISYHDGHMADLRITKGVARYTTTFTPPTEAYPTS